MTETQLNEKEIAIQLLEKANKENIERIKFIECQLHEKNKKIEELINELNRLKNDGRPQSFLQDTVYAIELLKREGIKSFFHRVYWYIRGKRLIEDILEKKGSSYVLHKK